MVVVKMVYVGRVMFVFVMLFGLVCCFFFFFFLIIFNHHSFLHYSLNQPHPPSPPHHDPLPSQAPIAASTTNISTLERQPLSLLVTKNGNIFVILLLMVLVVVVVVVVGMGWIWFGG